MSYNDNFHSTICRKPTRSIELRRAKLLILKNDYNRTQAQTETKKINNINRGKTFRYITMNSSGGSETF